MWPFSLGPPFGSPLHKGLTVRVVETGGCDGGIRRRVWEGKVVGFVDACEKWPNSNFEKGSPTSVFAEIRIDPKKAFVNRLNGDGTKEVMYYPASPMHWNKHEDGVWEYLI